MTTIRTSKSELWVRFDGPEDAPVLVFSNSLGTSLEMWDPQIAALAGHFRILRYDQRGHGRSAVPTEPFDVADLSTDVVELLDAIGCERAAFVGLSLGGMVGMALASEYPDRVASLLLACTAPRMPPPESWIERAQTVRQRGTGALAELLLGRWFTGRYRADHPQVTAEFTRMLEDSSDQGYEQCCLAIAHMDQRSALGHIACPTLVVAGAEDPVATPEVALDMQRAIPGSSLLVIDHAAHIANVEQAERFTEALLSHMTGTTFERGLRQRRRVLGDAYVDAALARTATSSSETLQAFQRFITEAAWGDIWPRPALDTRTRRLITLSVLASLGRLEEFELHTRAALSDTSEGGLNAEAIGEALLHVSVYAGVPAANAAFAVLTRLSDPS